MFALAQQRWLRCAHALQASSPRRACTRTVLRGQGVGHGLGLHVFLQARLALAPRAWLDLRRSKRGGGEAAAGLAAGTEARSANGSSPRPAWLLSGISGPLGMPVQERPAAPLRGSWAPGGVRGARLAACTPDAPASPLVAMPLGACSFLDSAMASERW